MFVVPILALAAAGCASVERTAPIEIGPAWLADFREKNVVAGIPIRFDSTAAVDRSTLDHAAIERAVADGRIARAVWDSNGLDLDGVRGGDVRRVLFLGDPQQPAVVIVEPVEAGPDDLPGQAARLGLDMGRPAYISPRFGILHRTQIPEVFLVVSKATADGPQRVGVARFCGPAAGSEEFEDWSTLERTVEQATKDMVAYQGLHHAKTRQELRQVIDRARNLGIPEANRLVAAVGLRLVEEFKEDLLRDVVQATAADKTVDARLDGAFNAAEIALVFTEVLGRMPASELELVRRAMNAFADAGEAWAKTAREEGRPGQAALYSRLAAEARLDPDAPPSASALQRFVDSNWGQTVDRLLAKAQDAAPPTEEPLDRKWEDVGITIGFACDLPDDAFANQDSPVVPAVLQRVRACVDALVVESASAARRAAAEGHAARATTLENLVAAIRVDSGVSLGKQRMQSILAEWQPTVFGLMLDAAEERATGTGTTLLEKCAAAGDSLTIAIEFDGASGRVPWRLSERTVGCVNAFADACTAECKRLGSENQPAEAGAFRALAAAVGCDASTSLGKQAMDDLRERLLQARNVIPLIQRWPSSSFEARLDGYAEIFASERALGSLGTLLAKYREELLPAAREQAEGATSDGRLATAAGCRLVAHLFAGGAVPTDGEQFGWSLEQGLAEGAGNIDRARHDLASVFARLVPVPDPAACARLDALVPTFEGNGMLRDTLAWTLGRLEVGTLTNAATSLTKLGMPLGRFEVSDIQGDVKSTRTTYTAPVRTRERQMIDNSAARDQRTAELVELKKQIDEMARLWIDAVNLANGHRDDALLARVAATTLTREFGELGYGQDMRSRTELYRDRLAKARNSLIDRYNDMLATRPLATSERIVEHEEVREFESVLFTVEFSRRLQFTGARGSGSEQQEFKLATTTKTPEEMRNTAEREFEQALPAAAASLFARLLSDRLDAYAEECTKKGGAWTAEARWAKCLLGTGEHCDPGLGGFLAAARAVASR